MVIGSRPVCPQGAQIHVSFLCGFISLSAAMQECNRERERRERREAARE